MDQYESCGTDVMQATTEGLLRVRNQLIENYKAICEAIKVHDSLADSVSYGLPDTMTKKYKPEHFSN
jgi:hypothetical protein